MWVEAELRHARLARLLADEVPQTCTVTLLACHAVPPAMSKVDWVRAACEELIPAAADEALVDAVDAYVEDIAFDLDDLTLVAQAARDAGLPLRVHADQLAPSGAAEAAVRLGARSAGHLNNVSGGGGGGRGGRRNRRRSCPRRPRSCPPPPPRRSESWSRPERRSPSPPTSTRGPRPCSRCLRRSRSAAPSMDCPLWRRSR